MVQISYPETSLERREPELSFDTKLDGITGLIVADIDTLKSVRIYLIALVNVENDNMGKLYKSHKNMIKGINSTLKSLLMS